MAFALIATDLSNAEIRELAKRIRPVHMFPNKGRCYVRRFDPFVDFMENPQIESQAENIGIFATITTFHKPAESGIFLATIAEVLAQIPRSPEEILHRTVAFEVLRRPKVHIDFKVEREAFAKGFLVAKTHLFEEVL